MIKIIPYSEEYKEDVINLILSIWDGGEFDYKGVERPDIHDVPKYYLQDKDSNFWVALDDKELIGTAGLIKKPDNSAHLKRMAVKEEYRKQGIGDKLIQTVIGFAKKHNIKTIYAGMVPENTAAIKFYKDHGFVECSIDSEDLVISDDPVYLKLNL